jgi:hypothetical protein
MKNCANRKDIFLKYRIYKALKKKLSISKISKIYKVSTRTIIEIKKNGFYKVDKLKLLINSILEKEPNFTLHQIKNFLNENYNISLSISTIYYKTSKTIDKKLAKFIQMLIEDGEFNEASKILSQFLYLPSETLYLLEKVDDNLLNYSLLADKYYYLLYSGKISVNDSLLEICEKYMKICKEDQLNYSYYKWLNLKLRILQGLGKYEEVIKNFDYKEIIKLPFNLKSFIFAVVCNCGIVLNNKIGIKCLNFFKRRFKSRRNQIKEISEDYKSFLMNQYVSLGMPKTAYQYKKEPFLDVFMGNYRKFFKIYNSLTIEMKIPSQILISWCYLFTKNFLLFLKTANKIQKNLEKFPVYKDSFIMTLALKEVIWGNYENAKNLLKSSSLKVLRAIADNNPNVLGKYRKYELLAKNLLKSNIKRAVEIAKKQGLITHLRIYTLLTKKSAKVLGKYRELRVISYILRNRPKFIKLYLLRRRPIIKIENKIIRCSGRENDIFALLYFISLEKQRSKTANVYELEREGFKNPISKAYNINRKIGYKILFVRENQIYLNAEVWTDIDEYLKTKNEKLYKCYPFDRLSFRYRWAEFYRDLIIT